MIRSLPERPRAESGRCGEQQPVDAATVWQGLVPATCPSARAVRVSHRDGPCLAGQPLGPGSAGGPGGKDDGRRVSLAVEPGALQLQRQPLAARELGQRRPLAPQPRAAFARVRAGINERVRPMLRSAHADSGYWTARAAGRR